jgi:nicotinamidase-related amidase
MGYIVDFQNDFVLSALPGGRLHVRHLADPADRTGSEKIIDAMIRLVRWMQGSCALTVFSGDGHRVDDPEVSAATPDFVDTYPGHCLAYSTDHVERAGAHLVAGLPEIPSERRVLRDASPSVATDVAISAIAERGPAYIEKSMFDVWTGNASMETFMATVERKLEQKPEIIIAGVAGDVCVAHALDGFLERGYRVTVVTDAIYTLDGNDDELFATWAERGAALTTVDEVGARGEQFP